MNFVGDVRVHSGHLVSEEIFKLVVEKPEGVESIAGQFFNFSCSKTGYPMLRRPISVSYVENDKIVFFIQVKGQGTQLLSELRSGDLVDIMGPLGNGFDFEGIEKPLIVGGGIGTAPMIEAVKYFSEHKIENPKVVLGFRDEPYAIEDYKKFTDNIEITSENAEGYHKGYVTDLVIKELETGNYDMVLICGPEIMLEKTAGICNERNVTSQVLTEEKMACGVGACLVCTCKIKKEEGYDNLRTCKDGPVFYGNEVIFGE